MRDARTATNGEVRTKLYLKESVLAPLLVTAIPLGIYDFTEGRNNVESAAAAGDNSELRQVSLADGPGAIIASILGSSFPPAVHIGHPGWKSSAAVRARESRRITNGARHIAYL